MSALRSPAALPVRFPLSATDEAMHLLDGGPWPTSVHVELRARGRIDPHRLRVAVLAATDAHPMLRAHRTAPALTDRSFEWRIAPALHDVPVVITEAVDDRAMDRLRAEALTDRIDLDRAPGFRVWLVHRPDGDAVLLNVNHAIADGIGSTRALRSLLAAYAGTDDPVPARHPLEAREQLARDHQVIDLVQRAAGIGTMLGRSGAPSAVLAEADGDDLGRTRRGRYVVHTTSIPLAPLHEVQRLARALAAAGDVPTGLRPSVNDVLLAALHRTVEGWNTSRHGRTGRIAVLMPVNLRPDDWRHDVVGNFAGMASIDTDEAERSDTVALLGAVARESARVRRQGAAGLLDLVGGNRLVPVALKRAMPVMTELLGARLGGAAVLSNLGAIDDIGSFGPDEPVTELWFSPPAQSPISLAVGVVGQGGMCRVVLRGCADRLDPPGLAELADRLALGIGAMAADLGHVSGR